MSKHYEELEALLLNYDFSELSPKQKAWVQQFVSQEDYEAQRTILQESQLLFTQKAATPNAQLKNLQQHFKQHHKKSIGTLLKHPIAAYQSVVLSCLVGALVWWLKPNTTTYETQIETVYQTQIDTVFQERIIHQEKIIYKTKTIELPAPPADTVYMPFANREDLYQPKKATTPRTPQQGKSMKDTKELMNFVVGVD